MCELCNLFQLIPLKLITDVIDEEKVKKENVNWLLCAGQLENIVADLTEYGIIVSEFKTEALPNPFKVLLKSVQVINGIKFKSKQFLKNEPFN